MGLSASEPKLASQVGNLAKSGKAQRLDNLRRLGRKRSCSGRWIYLGKTLIISQEGVSKEGASRDARPTEVVRESDESIVVMNPVLMNTGNGWEEKTRGMCTAVCTAGTDQKSVADAKGRRGSKRVELSVNLVMGRERPLGKKKKKRVDGYDSIGCDEQLVSATARQSTTGTKVRLPLELETPWKPEEETANRLGNSE